MRCPGGGDAVTDIVSRRSDVNHAAAGAERPQVGLNPVRIVVGNLRRKLGEAAARQAWNFNERRGARMRYRPTTVRTTAKAATGAMRHARRTVGEGSAAARRRCHYPFSAFRTRSPAG